MGLRGLRAKSGSGLGFLCVFLLSLLLQVQETLPFTPRGNTPSVTISPLAITLPPHAWPVIHGLHSGCVTLVLHLTRHRFCPPKLCYLPHPGRKVPPLQCYAPTLGYKPHPSYCWAPPTGASAPPFLLVGSDQRYISPTLLLLGSTHVSTDISLFLGSTLL